MFYIPLQYFELIYPTAPALVVTFAHAPRVLIVTTSPYNNTPTTGANVPGPLRKFNERAAITVHDSIVDNGGVVVGCAVSFVVGALCAACGTFADNAANGSAAGRAQPESKTTITTRGKTFITLFMGSILAPLFQQ